MHPSLARRSDLIRRIGAGYGACGLLVLCGHCLGCGGGDKPETVSVSGQITLGGGAWPVEGMLIFTPVQPAPGFPSRPGRAPFDTEGFFEAGTWQPGDGLMPGQYKICVECWSVPPSMGGPPAKGHVPAKYQTVTTSDLSLDVQPGSDAHEVAWDIPISE